MPSFMKIPPVVYEIFFDNSEPNWQTDKMADISLLKRSVVLLRITTW